MKLDYPCGWLGSVDGRGEDVVGTVGLWVGVVGGVLRRIGEGWIQWGIHGFGGFIG